MAMLEEDAKDLVWRPAAPLFGNNVARVAFKRSAYLRNFVYHFAEFVSPKLKRETIMKAMSGDFADHEL
jgi:LysR family cys regulon transcriptional activator